MSKAKPRLLVTGGGTGGHIFPAISIANAFQELRPDAEILFVGANGGMEMTVVPKHGYEIKGVTISGIMRRLTLRNILKNLAFPFKLMKSLSQARGILKEFKPDVVVGVGGYASGPVGRAAAKMGIPLVVTEQNALPGKTNKWLAPHAKAILLGLEGAAKYFQQYADKTRVTGNPVRASLKEGVREKGIAHYRLDASKPIVLSLGGSLGARAMNDAWEAKCEALLDAGIQLVWQCGKRYYEELKPRVKEHPGLRLVAFIEDMGNAYAMADVIVSRAGASTISELILLNKVSILMPSPNVAEDHQTKNALSLAEKNASVMVRDAEASEKLVPTVLEILKDENKFKSLQAGIEATEKHDSAMEMAREVLKWIKE